MKDCPAGNSFQGPCRDRRTRVRIDRLLELGERPRLVHHRFRSAIRGIEDVGDECRA